MLPRFLPTSSTWSHLYGCKWLQPLEGKAMLQQVCKKILISCRTFLTYPIVGLHDVDKKWVQTVKANGSKAKVKGMFHHFIKVMLFHLNWQSIGLYRSCPARPVRPMVRPGLPATLQGEDPRPGAGHSHLQRPRSNQLTLLFCAERLLHNLLQENGFDGVVLEVWSQLGGQYSEELSKVINQLSHFLRDRKFVVILVIPPAVYHG